MSGRLLELALFVAAAVAAVVGFGPPRALVGYSPGARPVAGLRIVTWNIGVTDAGDPARRRAELERVSEALVALDADLAVLQEVTRDELDELSGPFPGARTAFAGRGAQSGNAVLARRGRLASLECEPVGGRAPVRVVYRPDEGPAVQLVGLHADAWSSETRNRQIGRAVDLLAEIGPLPVHVLAGDLNLDVDPGRGKDLFTEDEYRDVESYNYVLGRMVDAAAGSGPTAEPDRRLDYVFVESEALAVADAGVWRGQRVGGMDHHPVVVDLR